MPTGGSSAALSAGISIRTPDPADHPVFRMEPIADGAGLQEDGDMKRAPESVAAEVWINPTREGGAAA